MRLTARLPDGHVVDVDVAVAPNASVGAVGAAVGATTDPGAPVAVDGQAVPAAMRWQEADVRSGVVLSAAAPHTAMQPLGAPGSRETINSVQGPGTSSISLEQLTGRGAGGRLTLPAGRYELSRGAVPGELGLGIAPQPSAELVVGHAGVVVRPHAGAVTIDGQPVESPCTLDEGVLTVDGTHFAVRARQAVRRAPVDSDGTATLRRPPRSMPASGDTDEVQVPQAPRPPAEPPRLSPVTMLAPMAVGVVMALLWNPMFLMFAAMTPVLVLARWFDGKRTAKRDRRQRDDEIRASLRTLRRDVAVAAARERRRRRATCPDMAELCRRAEDGAPTLWERRLDHTDTLVLTAGIGAVGWQPPTRGTADLAEVRDVLAAAGPLVDVPVPVDLRAGRGVAVVGPREAAVAVARSLVVQAAVLHGPADLHLSVLTDADQAVVWQWARWLPHLALSPPVPDSPPGRSSAAERVAGLDDDPLPGPIELMVVDGGDHLTGPTSPARSLLDGPQPRGRAVVVCETPEAVPAVCTTVLTLDGPWRATLSEPRLGRTVPGVAVPAVTLDRASKIARALAGWRDPEAPTDTILPREVALDHLLDIGLADREENFESEHDEGAERDAIARTLADRWRQLPPDPRLPVTMGVSRDGPVTLDLVHDGPHALLAGTTGSGKSELLRTVVASLAWNLDPDHLNVVLLDFKGGGAFDACATLPHTVAVVTDLDDHLAARALRCLRAEVRYREQTLRAAGATHLSDYLHQPHPRPLPRLVVVIDEFATLAAELPDFLDSLVDIAQRGRSLGIHLLLATQRPTGVVDAKIRANTNLRIALRVQDDHDSADVVGITDAATLRRDEAGRGYLRLGAGEVVAFQAARATAPLAEPAAPAITVSPLPPPNAAALARRNDNPHPSETALAPTGPTALDRLVERVRSAAARAGTAPPRPVWPAPLPDRLDAEALVELEPDRIGAAPLGLVDRPDDQRQDVAWWDPAEGNLLVYGVDAAWRTATLATVALGLAHRNPADRCHLYVLDGGGHTLAPLGALSHTGAYVPATDDERSARLVDLLDRELERRRSVASSTTGRPAPLVVLLVEDYGAAAAGFEEAGRIDLSARLSRIVRDGPALGLFTVASAAHERGIPMRVANLVDRRLLLRLADASAVAAFGLRPRDVPALGPGRAILAASGMEVQIARFAAGDLRAAVGAVAPAPVAADRLPAAVRRLDTILRYKEALPPATHGDRCGAGSGRSAGSAPQDGAAAEDTLRLPVAVTAADLQPAALILHRGEHAIVLGPPRSGRSTALCTLAAGALGDGRDRPVVAVTPLPSPLSGVAGLAKVNGANELEAVVTTSPQAQPGLVLVDDAEAVDAATAAALARLAADPLAQVSLIVAARPAFVRDLGSWVQTVRGARAGLLLQPAPHDGDLLRTVLPLRTPQRWPAGRGFLVDGGAPELAQVVLPPAEERMSVPSACGRPA